MRIVLRILIVLLAILSGVSLYFGIKLFNQREQIKARTSILEQSIVDLSWQIETEVPPDLGTRKLPPVKVDIRDIKQYFFIDRLTGLPKETTDPKTGKKTFVTEGAGTMKNVLKALLEKAKQQTDILDKTRLALQEVRQSLTRSQQKVADLKSKLLGLEGKIDSLSDEGVRLKDEMSELKNTLDTKEEQIVSLNAQIEDQKTKLLKQEEKMFLQQSNLTALDKRNSDLQDRIRRLEAEKGLQGSLVHEIQHGLKGTIAQVNPEWSFVVINLNPDAKIAHDITLLIRRDDNLVGRVKVLRIKPEENLAIAEILWPWMKLPMQKGDIVDYVGE